MISMKSSSKQMTSDISYKSVDRYINSTKSGTRAFLSPLQAGIRFVGLDSMFGKNCSPVFFQTSSDYDACTVLVYLGSMKNIQAIQ